ncbi:hypothetical protein ACLB2K_047004 [Fragaria x ananassa]
MRKAVVLPVFTAMVSTVWSLKERVLIREKEPRILVFQFKSKVERDQVIGGGSWFYEGMMVMLATPMLGIAALVLDVGLSVVLCGTSPLGGVLPPKSGPGRWVVAGP